MVGCIISGGQTGCDRAALDAAIELGLPHGGFCPRGRLAEDGRIPDRYQLVELETTSYPARTRRNVAAADAVLVLWPAWNCAGQSTGNISGGTQLTLHIVRQLGKRNTLAFLEPNHWAAPLYIRDHQAAYQGLMDGKDNWTLMVAGPRESKHPGVYKLALEWLLKVLPRRNSAAAAVSTSEP